MGGRWAFAALAAVSGIGAAFFGWIEWDQRTAPPIVIEDPRADATIVVAVEGGVATPGVYAVSANARVYEVLAQAGGTVSGADLASVNPAARVRDGDRLIVPLLPPTPSAFPGPPKVEPIGSTLTVADDARSSTAGRPAMPTPPGGDVPPIDINTATVAELDGLPGIGPVLAQRIVDYRTEQGPFSTVEELAEVQGISEKMVDELRSRLIVGS